MRKFYSLLLMLLVSVGAWAQVITAVGDQITDLSTFTTGTGHGDHYLVKVIRTQKGTSGTDMTDKYLYSVDENARIKAQDLTPNSNTNYQHIFNIFKLNSGNFKLYVNDKGVKGFTSGSGSGFNISRTTPADEYEILPVEGQTGVFQLKKSGTGGRYLTYASDEVQVTPDADVAMLIKIYKATVTSSEFTIDTSKSYYLVESTSGLIVNNANPKKGNGVSEVTLSAKIGSIKPFKIEKTTNGLYTFKNETTNEYLSAGWWDAEMSTTPFEWVIEKVEGDAFALHFLGNGDANYQTGFLGTENKSAGQKLFSNQTINAGKVLKFVLKASDEKIAVTYSFQVDGAEKKREAFETIPGWPFPVPDQMPAYVNYTLPAGNVQASDAGQTKTVVCTYSLPFEISESYDAAKWYMIDIHSNQGQFMWKYTSGATPNIITDLSNSKQTAVLSDEYMWCFTGNPFEGFEIYNKAADNSMKLYREGDVKESSCAVMASGNDQKFELFRSTSSVISGAFCLRPVGHSNFINRQNNQLNTWNATDEGSSCRVFAPTAFVKNTIDSYLNMPVGAVGAPVILKDYYESLSAANEAIIANPWGEISADVTNALNALNASEKVSMSEGYYFLKTGDNQNASGRYMTYNGTNCEAVALGASEKLAAKHVWKIESAGAEGKYKMSSCNLGNYLKAITATSGASTITETSANATIFTFTDNGSAQIIIRDGGDANKTMRTEGDGRVNYWSGYEKDRYWYVIPAELDITIGDAGYASAYYSFPVKPSTGLQAYAITSVGGESATLVAQDDIPANQGAILKGEKETTYKLTAQEATSDWTGNKLTGTNEDAYVPGDAYVLAKDGDNVGLYKAKLNKDANGNDGDSYFKNNANKAYLPASELTSARFLTFNFDDNAETGINAVEIEEAAPANAAIYDLSGRRVQSAKSGLYIINGKKVIK